MYGRAYVEITNKCNKSCSFCHGTKRKAESMTLGEFARIAGNLKGVTEYLYFHVLGEPLLHPMLPTFIEYASACGFKVALTTNGALLPKVGDKLIAAGVYKVNISLHSFEEDSEEEKEEYINACLDFADKASESGVLCVLRLWNKLAQESEEGRRTEEANRRVERILRDRFGEFASVGARGARIKNKLHVEYGARFEWPDIENPDMGDRVFCHGLDDHFGILADGTVVPCCLDADGVMALGNIFEEDIRTILSSERARNIRKGFSEKKGVEELCRKCPYARRFKI